MVKKLADGHPLKLLQCDEPSPYTGRIYPQEEMEKAVAKYQAQIDAGVAYGTFGADERPDQMNISNVSHRVTELSVNEKGEVFATVEFLDTPAGKHALALITDTPLSVRLSPAMIGKVDENREVYDAEIFQTTWLPTVE